MRTLATQVKLRRLIRTSAQDWGRLASDPLERARAGSVADRLLELAAEVRGAWRRESQPGAGTLEGPLLMYVGESLRSKACVITPERQPLHDTFSVCANSELAPQLIQLADQFTVAGYRCALRVTYFDTQFAPLLPREKYARTHKQARQTQNGDAQEHYALAPIVPSYCKKTLAARIAAFREPRWKRLDVEIASRLKLAAPRPTSRRR